MSPLSLRRYRAERLLRQHFQALHTGVLAAVAARLRARRIRIDEVDLEACYAEAWHSLYGAVLAGREISNPAGWLALVTFRRAIDEHRARRRLNPGLFDGRDSGGAGPGGASPGAAGPNGAWHGEGDRPRRAGETLDDRDFADELDDRARVRELFEGLRARLSARELQAATLCYLHGLSRADAAAQMGVSEARMRKLMEGHGPGRPGVARKVGALVATIRDGGWCEEQGSLMRGLALGILDPAGERYRLAQLHREQCPACRAYVRALRGLAAVLPPVPALLRLVLDGARGAAGGGAGGLAAHGGASLSGGLGSGASPPGAGSTLARSAGGAGAGASAGGGTGVGAGAGTGAGAGAGAGAGGGWLLAGGGAATKLAVGCLVAAGLSAGCVALTLGPAARHDPGAHHRLARRAKLSPGAAGRDLALSSESAPAVARTLAQPALVQHSSPVLSPAAKASREFGLEQPGSAGAGAASEGVDHTAPAARAVAAGAPSSIASPAATGGQQAADAERSGERTREGASSGSRTGGSAAEREFGIG